MRNYLLLMALVMTSAIASAQVGIGTLTPNSNLDIPATNQATPTNTDGILIPRVDAFPLTNPTAAQNGMMVFLTTLSGWKPPGFYYWDQPSTTWKGIGGNIGWNLTGNSGTSAATNFVGTTDAVDLIFKRNNVQSGRLNPANTSFGVGALNPANSGVYNTGVGAASLTNNGSGHSNTSVGSYAMFTNVGGVRNTAVGTNTMYYNLGGEKNTAVGNNALNANQSGNNNVAFGNDALYGNQTGSNNTAVGNESGNLITGSNNITIGAATTVPTVSGNDQMSIGNVIYGTTMSTTALGKIGIGETAPSAKLQISSATPATPANTDGIIIPRVSTLTATGSMTAAQNGMMVFLTTLFSGNQPGFYYWDQPSTSWKGLAGSATADADFYEVGTTTPPDAITDAMFHSGNVGIGNVIPTYKLDIDETASGKLYALRAKHSNAIDGSTTSSIRSEIAGSFATGIIQGISTSVTPGSGTAATGLQNNLQGTSAADVYGVNSNISTAGVGARTGVNNSFIGTGTGISYGIQSTFSNASAAAYLGVNSSMLAASIGDKTGLKTRISNSTGGFHTGVSTIFTNNNGAMEETGVYSEFTGSSVGNIRGAYNQITNSGSGVHYGLYNNINGSGGFERYGVENVLSGSSGGIQYGVENTISATGNNTHYGTQNYLNGTGTGSHFGIRNWLASTGIGEQTGTENLIDNSGLGIHKGTSNTLSGAGNGEQYGTYNYITNTGAGTKYGSYNKIFSTAGAEIHYGVYSDVLKATGYAGYFLGRFSIGTTAANSYIMPASRGTANQVMQTDGSGNVSWQNANAFAWSLTGNSGYNPSTTFIGSTDSKEVFFRHTNQPSGVIGFADTAFGYRSLGAYSLTARNTAIGTLALENNTVSTENSVLGSEALNANTAGSRNVAFGNRALYKQSFANAGAAYNTQNVAVGYAALYNTNGTSNANGLSNIGVGIYALANNATGSRNVAIGGSSLGVSQTGTGTMSGDDNIAIGSAAMKSLDSGSQNIAMGNQTLGYNTTGDDNVALGYNAMFYNTGPSRGVAIGSYAMQHYGYTSSALTNDNVAVGYESLKGAVCCYNYSKNTAIGYQSLSGITVGTNNTANGYQSLIANAGGNFNAAFGSLALTANSSGANNVALGYNAMSGNITGSNNIAIGAGAFGPTTNGSNQLSIGNVIYGSNMDNLTATPANLAIGATPITKYRLYNYTNQITANGVGQYGIFTHRTRNSLNDGTGYSLGATNAAIAGYNFYGDMYTFGTIGYSYWDSNRSGGILGSHTLGATWSSLAYKASSGTGYAIYATTAVFTGTGRYSQPQSQSSIGGGFYGGLIGSWSKGVIGNISSGSMFASYNSGDEYTSGKQIELVDTGSAKTAAYTVTSTDVIIYKKGKITLIGGVAHVAFDSDYAALLGDVPVVTTTPMGQCNGIYIESVDKSGFTIRELNNGSSNVAVSWIAVGDRIDGRTNTPQDLLDKDFEADINDVMFNENDKVRNAKAMWSEGNKLRFGTLPASLNPQEQKTEEVKQ